MNLVPTRPHQCRVVTVFQLFVGLFLSLSALGQPAFLKDGLVAYYPFNGNANDENGNVVNGVVVDLSYGVNRFNQPSSSGVFNGSSTIIECKTPSSGGNYTLSAWVRIPSENVLTGIDRGWYTIYISGNYPQEAALGINPGLGYIRNQSGGGLIDVPLLHSDVLRWMHVVAVWKDGLAKITIDGQIRATVGIPIKSNNTPVASQQSIGFVPNPKRNLFKGEMDDLRIYNRALSDAEVKALYDYESTPPDNSYITNGLVAYYPFDGNAIDSIGNFNGTIVGATASADRFGKLNACYSFNGSGNRIDFSNPPIQSNDNWTISAWINPANFTQEGIAVQLGFDDGLSAQRSNGYGFGFAKNSTIVGISSGIDGFFSSGTSLTAAAQWYHIVMTRDSIVTKIYINGAKSLNDSFVKYKSPTDFTIGSQNGLRWFNGAIDEVRIYNRALSESEIKALYNYESTPPNNPPLIVFQPQNQSVTTGNDATFCVTLEGAGTYNYQWQRNEKNIAGATLNCYTINSVTAAMDGSRYRVIVSNSAGTIISDSATLTVVTPPPPTIATQPTSKTVQEGVNVSLSVVASGQGTLVYQWQFNEQNLPGATSSTLNLNAVKLNTAGRYRVLVSSQYGVTISDTVTLTVNPNPPPTIVTQPISRTPAEGTQVSLTVTATGIGTITYQWQVNGQNIPGATSSTLVLSAVRPSVNGAYRVIVGNPYGTTISSEATIAVVVTDSDNDGLSDYEELLTGTDSNKADSDGDGLSDFAEVRTYNSNPLTTDTDSDGYSDGIEVARDGNPNNRSVTPTGALAVFPAVDVEFYTLNGVKYQLEVSNDMATWTAQGGVVVGTGGNQNHLVRASKATQFWRLKVVP